MASIDIFGGSYFHAPWQDVVNPDANLIEIPYGGLSDLFNGFAYQNTDGTYTVFIGEDPIAIDENGNASGVVTDIIRLESLFAPLDADNVLAHVWEGFTASGIQDAYLDGGYTFLEVLFIYEDVVTIDSPSFGGIQWPAPPVATSSGADTVYGSLHHDTIDTGSGADTAYGDEGDDIIHAGVDDDLIYGDEGADVLYGESGWDILYGGAGADSLFGGGGQDSLYGEGGNDFISGGNGYDRLEGNAGNDVIEGNGGDDRLFGGAGADSLYGGAGDDSLYGGDGYNTLYGDNGDDFIRGGRHDDTAVGGDGDDTIVGQGGDDALYGGDNNDFMVGEDGDDLLQGGNGDDYLDGGDGLDSALYLLPRAYYTVTEYDTFVMVSSVGDEGTDTLRNVERLLFADQIMWV
ncbi:MAG: calcium-binding protein [Alphaproteobacteria bacterium]